jgi:hypothetical protein
VRFVPTRRLHRRVFINPNLNATETPSAKSRATETAAGLRLPSLRLASELQFENLFRKTPFTALIIPSDFRPSHTTLATALMVLFANGSYCS